MAVREQLREPFGALTGAFFARFFENEITVGFDDLKGAFFWMLAALAIPGLFLPWMLAFDWQLIAMVKGPLALREASQGGKVFYLGFAMAASGLLTTIAWNSLLPDRRDTLILGALPVTPAAVVAAKLAALAGYILLIALSMHSAASVFYGLILSTKSDGLFALRGILAHFVASTAASAGVALVVAAVQGLTLAMAGPRIFRRVSIVLQVALVGLMAALVAALPVITFSVEHTVRGFGGHLRPWVLDTPPVWFLGLYEWVLGTSDPVLTGLAAKAGLVLLTASLAIVATFPLAYRRLMVSVVETGGGPGRNVLARLGRAFLRLAAGRHPEARAAVDFYTATLARVERHRFILALAVGLALTWNLAGWKLLEPSPLPSRGWLSLPLSTMVFLVLGLRIAASLPGDVRAGWLFDLSSPSRVHARRALERSMLLLGVLPPVLLATPVYWLVWGRSVALIHAAVTATLGLAFVQLVIWHHDGMPCGQRWKLAHASLGYRWPVYAAVFFVATAGVPELEMLLFPHVRAALVFIAVIVALAVVARYASARHEALPSYDDVDPVAGVLRLG